MAIIRYIGMIPLNPHHASKGCYSTKISRVKLVLEASPSPVSDEGWLGVWRLTDSFNSHVLSLSSPAN